MAVLKDPTGKVAPSGGFANGGWYSGYQYFNGSFAPSAGQIHPQSPQQGAGTMVSPEVNRQTSIQAGKAPNANQTYVDQLNAKPIVNPSVITSGGASTGAGVPTTGVPTTGAGVGYTSPEAPDLTLLYNNAFKEAGISDLEKAVADKMAMLTNTESKINDNPFLSEASRVGRISKVREKLNQEITNIQNQLATKKADVETKLNLALKQFDINSQVAKDALSRANTLLEMGVLDGASGEDIANLTRSTGISSSAWYSAIKANKDKNIKTSVSTASDDTGQYAVVINSQTGEIIAKNKIAEAKSDSLSTSETNQQNTQKINKAINESANSYGHLSPSDWKSALTFYTNSGLGTANDFIISYAGYTDPNRGDFESATGYGFSKDLRKSVVSGNKNVTQTQQQKLYETLGINQ